MAKKNFSVADYITAQIDYAGKTQTEIAKDLGYEKPNIITMFKQGRTKLPMNKIVPLANSLGVDPLNMLRVVMQDYSPETWEVLEKIIGSNLVSEDEMEMISMIRAASDGHSLKPETKEELDEFKSMVAKWKKRVTAPRIKHPVKH